jgi:hypothetical protein
MLSEDMQKKIKECREKKKENKREIQIQNLRPI